MIGSLDHMVAWQPMVMWSVCEKLIMSQKSVLQKENFIDKEWCAFALIPEGLGYISL